VGFLLSYLIHRRWLSLTGLAVGFAAIAFGALTKNGTLLTIMALVAVVLVFAGMVVSVYKNVKAMRAGRPPRS
jgi:membrane-associated PAP2 superfamily phosphatase